MRTANSSRKTCVAVSIVACAVLFPATQAQAQTFAELQNLAFYPVPLATLGTEPAAVPAESEVMEVIDMAMFEESAINSYEQDIADIQGRAGSYAPELAQQLTSAGLLYQQQNRHEEAVTSLQRAAESSRIHHGLYSSDQVVLAEYTINSLMALGRFDEAEDKYHEILNIHVKLYGPEAAQVAHALQGLGEQQLEYRDDAFYEAQAHFVDAIRILIDREAWSDPALLALEQDLVRTYYIDARRTGVIDNPLSYAINDESRVRTLDERMAISELYQKGKQAYLRMLGYLQKNPEADIAVMAHAMLELADWHQLFGKRAEADDQYGHLDEIMALGGAAAAEAAAIVRPAVPVTLPAFIDTPLSPRANFDTSAAQGYVDLSFTVNRHGRAKHLEVLGTSAAVDSAAVDSAVADRLSLLVRTAQFRPAADAEYSLRYYFAY